MQLATHLYVDVTEVHKLADHFLCTQVYLLAAVYTKREVWLNQRWA